MSEEAADPVAFSERLGSLLSPEGGPVIRVDGQQWCLVEYHSTGRLRTRTVRSGAVEWIAQVPEKAPYRVGSAASLEELVTTYGSSRTGEDWGECWSEQAQLRVERAARDRELTELVTDTVTRRVMAAAAAAQPVLPTERRKCRNCKGRGGGSHVCSCKDRGVYYFGVPSNPDDLVTDEPVVPDNLAPREQGFDPDCSDCQGSGFLWWTCPVCAGVGKEPACLDWLITGPDGEMSVRFDVAALLRARDVDVHVQVESMGRHARVTVRTDSRLLVARVNSMVAEGQPTWVRTDTHFQDWNFDVHTSFQLEMTPLRHEPPEVPHDSPPLTESDGPFKYVQVSYDRHSGNLLRDKWVSLDEIASAVPSGERLLEQLQQQASGNPWLGVQEVPADSALRGADGLIERVPYSAVVKMSLSELFDDAVSQAASAGYALGLAYGFIATGQYGPSVYLLTSDDKAISEIGNDYYWHGAIAEAHARLPKLLSRLDSLDDGQRSELPG